NAADERMADRYAVEGAFRVEQGRHLVRRLHLSSPATARRDQREVARRRPDDRFERHRSSPPHGRRAYHAALAATRSRPRGPKPNGWAERSRTPRPSEGEQPAGAP